MRDYTSWAPCGIVIKIEGFLKILFAYYFLFSLHQGTLSILCSRIQSCMLSLMNEVNPCVASVACFVWDANLRFQQVELESVLISVHLPAHDNL